jgi:hypothetical protein
MTRTCRILISLGVMAVAAIGAALAEETGERESRPADTGFIPAASRQAATDGQTPATGPRGRYKMLLRTIEVPEDRTNVRGFLRLWLLVRRRLRAA